MSAKDNSLATKRCLNLDVFRLLCMLLITSIHTIGYNEIGFSNDAATNTVIAAINAIDSIAVNGFILLSAYFLNKPKQIFRKIAKLEVQLLTYGLVLLGVSVVLKTFGIGTLVKSIFPILSYHWWYPINYILLVLLSPYLCDWLNSLNKKKHLSLIVIFFITIQCYLQCNPFIDSPVFLGDFSHGFLWWIELFVIGNYLKKYGVQIKVLSLSISFSISILCLFLHQFLGFADLIKNANLPEYMANILDVFKWNGAFSLIATVSLFMIFSKLKLSIPDQKPKLILIVNKLSAAIFGVYLIQEHNGIKTWLWDTVSISKYKWFEIPIVTIVLFVILLLCSTLINELNIKIFKTLERVYIKMFLKKEYNDENN